MKRRGVARTLAGAVLLVASLARVAPAEAGTTQCTGTLPTGITVPGSLSVPDGEHCILHGATVVGDVTVLGSLFMDLSRVGGSVAGDDAQVGVSNSRISKGVTTTKPRSGFFVGPAFLLCNTNVVGNVTVRDAVQANSASIGGPFCPEGTNKIAGSLLLQNNAPEHDLYVWNTQISGNLVCQASSNPDVQNVTVLGTVQNGCA